MKRRLRVLVVFAGTIAIAMALNIGAASADHGENPNSPFGTTPAEAVVFAPVGTHIQGADDPGNPGSVNGFEHFGDAIANNPNCPLHYAP